MAHDDIHKCVIWERFWGDDEGSWEWFWNTSLEYLQWDWENGIVLRRKTSTRAFFIWVTLSNWEKVIVSTKRVIISSLMQTGVKVVVSWDTYVFYKIEIIRVLWNILSYYKRRCTITRWFSSIFNKFEGSINLTIYDNWIRRCIPLFQILWIAFEVWWPPMLLGFPKRINWLFTISSNQ